MAIYASANSAPRELAPDGNHRAVCYAIYDLGTHQMPDMKNGGLKSIRKVRICFELSDEIMADGRPFTVSQEYGLSLYESSNLGKMLEKWRGKPFTDEERKKFDIAILLGQCCLVNVVHEKNKTSGQTYANLGGVSRLAKGMTAATAVNPLREFSFDDHDEIPDGTPDWIAKKIRMSAEWLSRGPGSERPVGSTAATGRNAGDDEDEYLETVPF